MVMNPRRAPLANNPNVANSPLRGTTGLAGCAKPKRAHTTLQREELYAQPPPIKKQALENGAQRAVRSPSKMLSSRQPQAVLQRSSTAARSLAKERASRTASTARTGQDVDTEKELWKKHHRAKFPKMVFYFESIPDDVRAKLTKRISYLGARQEPFFSIEVTHVITTRAIPPEKSDAEHVQLAQLDRREPDEQPQTINPSLLNRNASTSTATAARRRLLFEFQRPQTQSQQPDDPTKRSKPARNNDVLHKAREMGKKIWGLDKFHTMLSVLLEPEAHAGNGSAKGSTRGGHHHGVSKSLHEPNLFQMLHNERINGPSDRDPTALARELTYFKGPFIYIWDMDERQKPIMVREYAKVANKTDGEWPQFRSVGNGRCPFVEEVEVPEKDHRMNREREKARAAVVAAAAAAAKPAEQSVQVPDAAAEGPAPQPVVKKRTVTEMEDAYTRVRAAAPATEVFAPISASALSKSLEVKPQNAFISRAQGGRMFAGEPVASGIQQSNMTSAIRSQMISSTSGINGAKAGTSKEVHGLQRKVLQKTSAASHSFAEVSIDAAASSRSTTTLVRTTSKTMQGQEDDGSQKAVEGKEKRVVTQSLKSKKDLKPGYCENCQDKFRDFDEHISSRKHRKFAENDDNWTELDALLGELKRIPKFSLVDGW